jgi:hypothetical protein
MWAEAARASKRTVVNASVGVNARRRSSLLGGVGEGLSDAALLLLVIVMLPLAMLLIGAPVALLIRLALEIGRRL